MTCKMSERVEWSRRDLNSSLYTLKDKNRWKAATTFCR